jgi:hypothetical protein
MALPADPKKLFYGVYDGYGRDLTKAKQSETDWMPFALRDTSNYEQDYYNDPYERSVW